MKIVNLNNKINVIKKHATVFLIMDIITTKAIDLITFFP
jgi:hypothetical protein